jgi:uncharacterized protein (UPF0332 family)
MSLEWCFRKGLLKKWTATSEVLEKELDLARNNLKEAEDLLDLGKYMASIIFSYISSFHSARALLYRDGYSERSHACLAEYLYEKYVLEGKLEGKYTSKLDELRRKRHDAFYTQSKEVSEEEAKEATDFASEFLKKIEDLLK